MSEIKNHIDAINIVKTKVSKQLVEYLDIASDVGFDNVSVRDPWYDDKGDGAKTHVGNECDFIADGKTIAHVGLIKDACGFMNMPMSFFNPQKLDEPVLLTMYLEKFKHIWKTHMSVLMTVAKHIDDRRRWNELQLRFYQGILAGLPPEKTRDELLSAAREMQKEMTLTLATLVSAKDLMIESRKEFLVAANRVHCALPEGVVEEYGEEKTNVVSKTMADGVGNILGKLGKQVGSGVIVLDPDDDTDDIGEKIRKAIEDATGGKVVVHDHSMGKKKDKKIGFGLPDKEDDDEKVH